MTKGKATYLSLTGDKSHQIIIPPGQGSFSIGTKGISTSKNNVWVEEGEVINWDAFDEFYTPFGREHMEEYPYGDWPRFFYYSGNDTGFATWSLERPIEDFYWHPSKAISLDLTQARISRFSVCTGTNPIKLWVGESISKIILSGNLHNISIKENRKNDFIISFSPELSHQPELIYQLPEYNLKTVTSVDFEGSPAKQTFDCKSLLQFPRLKHLNLFGNCTNLEVLDQLTNLESIGLRHMPAIKNMPKLSSWQNLKRFIAWNVEETAGKALKKELNDLTKQKDIEYVSVSKLQKPIWFTTNYNLPFRAWEVSNEKAATKAYKSCLTQIKKAKTENTFREAIVTFVNVINTLPTIETSEREDVWTAINQLAETSSINVSTDLLTLWFDEARKF